MTANEQLTLGISLVALVLSGASLYLSLRREDEKRQLKLVARKHEVVRLLLSVEELIKTGREALPVIANLMTSDQRTLHEAALKKVYEDFKKTEEGSTFAREYIEGLNISGRMVAHDTSILLEDIFGRGQKDLEEATRMNGELRELHKKLKQENEGRKSEP
jgi:hypothetical protein